MWICKIHIFSDKFWKKIENRSDFFEKKCIFGILTPHYDVIGGSKNLKILSQTYFWPFCQVSSKSERIFWKIVIFGPFDPPLWRHRPKFKKWWRHQKIFQLKLGGYAKFQENRWSRFGVPKELPILKIFFIKYQILRCLTPHYDVIRGSIFAKKVHL